MMRFEAWDTEKLRFEELPTIRDLLQRVDVGLVADALMPHHARSAEWRREDSSAFDAVRAEAEAILSNLLATPQISAVDEWVLTRKCVVEDIGMHIRRPEIGHHHLSPKQ